MAQHTTWINDVYRHLNAADLDSVEPYFAPDVQTQTPGGPMKTRDEWRAFGTAFYTAVPDAKHEIVRSFEDGDTIIVEGVFSGTQTGPLVMESGTIPASGNAFAFPYVDLFELRDGICVGHRVYWDNVGFLMQLGVTP
jgi:ketosteroid isomerase-like protein